MKDARFDPVKGNIVTVFFHYAVPSVIGMLAVTSAGVIDGMFIGNYVGATALAAVNISLPAFYLFVGVALMLAVGGSVMCGKFLGEGDQASASSIFSKTIYASAFMALLIVLPSVYFLDEVITALGANDEVRDHVRSYMQVILWFAPFFIVGLTLDYFVRVDGRPVLSSLALVCFALINISLDWLFIVKWGWGIEGAAWAMAIADCSFLLVLASHLFSPACTLKFRAVPLRWRNGWDAVFRAAWNGFSEFANESSVALITLLFNWVMISRLGVEGVAAFTIVGYLLMIGLEVCYGVSDSLQPMISKNLGARQPQRIARFLQIGVGSVFLIGLGVSALLILMPEVMIDVFLAEGEQATEAIALAFVALFWPAFLFNGVNIALAAFFTSMHKPVHSAMIAISRSLVLPILGLLLLPRWFGDDGVFLAVPIAEGFTLLVALALLAYNRPSKLVTN
jgi:Na+-driven multidrug efflux pump